MLNDETLLKIRSHCPGYVWNWVYKEHGRPVMIVARYESKGEKTYRQFSYRETEWEEGVATTPYPLFGLDSLTLTSPLKSVLICEGEKCASLLHQLQWNGLATAFGTKSVNLSDFSPTRYFKQFIILRDNDKAGIAYARSVSVAIRKLRPEAEILICNLTPELSGGDLIDWVLKYPLSGHSWDGYSELKPELIPRVAEALQDIIQKVSIPLEECKEIGFKPELALFEGDPHPLENKLRPVPDFPIDLLLDSIKKYLSLSAKQMSIPIDFPATTFFSLIGGIVGRGVSLEMRPGQRWEEAANVWAVMVGPPAAKKSPTLRRMCRSLAAIEDRSKQEYVQAMKEYKARKKAAEVAKQSFDESEPVLRRYISDDCTTPKLRELLASNPRGLILRSDELKGQLEKFERNGNEGDRSMLMQCWSGLELYNEDRIIRGSCLQIPLTLAWIACIQPSCLSQYLRQAMSDSKGADGFMQRFQMVTFPDFDKPFEICQESMPSDLEKAIEDLFTEIDQMARTEKRKLTFTPKAQTYFDTLQTWLETQCRSKEHPTYWESHLGKQCKLLAALCIILHVLEEALLQKRENTISLETLQAAEMIMHYYLEHAQRCYESIESCEIADARKILELIRRKKLQPRFKPADIYHNNLGGIKESDRVANALRLLQDRGCVAVDRVPGLTKPTEYWVVHPKLLEKELLTEKTA